MKCEDESMVIMAGMMHSTFLFTKDDGMSMGFNVELCGDRDKIIALIEHGGGLVHKTIALDTIQLIEPECKDLNFHKDETVVYVQYIFDCVAKNRLLDMNRYVINFESHSVGEINCYGNDDNNTENETHSDESSDSNESFSDKDGSDYYDNNSFSDDSSDNFVTTRRRGLKNNNRATALPTRRTRFSMADDKKVIQFLLTNSKELKYEPKYVIYKKLQEHNIVSYTLRRLYVHLRHISDNIALYNLSPSEENLLKKTAFHRAHYSHEEDLKLIDYITRNKLHMEVRNKKLYIDMAKQGVLNRNYLSMYRHFTEIILPNLHKYNLSNHDQHLLRKSVRPLRKAKGDLTSNSSSDSEKSTSLERGGVKVHIPIPGDMLKQSGMKRTKKNCTGLNKSLSTTDLSCRMQFNNAAQEWNCAKSNSTSKSQFCEKSAEKYKQQSENYIVDGFDSDIDDVRSICRVDQTRKCEKSSRILRNGKKLPSHQSDETSCSTLSNSHSKNSNAKAVNKYRKNCKDGNKTDVPSAEQRNKSNIHDKIINQFHSNNDYESSDDDNNNSEADTASMHRKKYESDDYMSKLRTRSISFPIADDKRIIKFLLRNARKLRNKPRTFIYRLMLKHNIVRHSINILKERFRYMLDNITAYDLNSSRENVLKEVLFCVVPCSYKDDLKMINYITKNNLYKDIGDLKLYKKMAKQCVFNRTYKSLYDHFMHDVLPNLQRYNLPDYDMYRLVNWKSLHENVSQKLKLDDHGGSLDSVKSTSSGKKSEQSSLKNLYTNFNIANTTVKLQSTGSLPSAMQSGNSAQKSCCAKSNFSSKPRHCKKVTEKSKCSDKCYNRDSSSSSIEDFSCGKGAHRTYEHKKSSRILRSKKRTVSSHVVEAVPSTSSVSHSKDTDSSSKPSTNLSASTIQQCKEVDEDDFQNWDTQIAETTQWLSETSSLEDCNGIETSNENLPVLSKQDFFAKIIAVSKEIEGIVVKIDGNYDLKNDLQNITNELFSLIYHERFKLNMRNIMKEDKLSITDKAVMLKYLAYSKSRKPQDLIRELTS